jgi:hypothetical protein
LYILCDIIQQALAGGGEEFANLHLLEQIENPIHPPLLAEKIQQGSMRDNAWLSVQPEAGASECKWRACRPTWPHARITVARSP